MQKRLIVFVLLLVASGIVLSSLPAQEPPATKRLPPIPGAIHLSYQVTTIDAPLSDADKKALQEKAQAVQTTNDETIYESGRHRLPDGYEPSADYWSDGRGRSCWTLDFLDRKSAIATPTTRIRVTEDQLGTSIVYAARKITSGTSPRANPAEATQATVPFLGFAQERKPDATDVLTFDDAGRLSRLQHGKQKNGDYGEEYTYSDYVAVVPGVAVPGVVVRWRRVVDEKNDAPNRTIYVLRARDAQPPPAERFERQHPPAGSFITDYRYLLGKNDPLRYRYAGSNPVDTESPRQYAAKKQAMHPVPSTIGKPQTQVNSAGITMVRLPGGTFAMGQQEIAEPVHAVQVSPFWIGRYEVTNAQFERYRKRPRPAESQSGNQPVTRVTYGDAVAYCQWLSKRTGARYRLPTEAEWEYAARGGLVQKRYPWGDIEVVSGLAALGQTQTSSVGSFYPNGFGLYDMAGNVAEWVSDWYDDAYYKHSLKKNPKGPARPPAVYGKVRTLRGGHFDMQQGECALRIMVPESAKPTTNFTRFKDRTQSDGTGFRVVKEGR